MKTERIHLPAMLLGGVSFYGDPFNQKSGWDSENEIGKTCSRFADYVIKNPQRSFSCGKKVSYEVHIYGDETKSKGYFEVFVGEEVNTTRLPVALLTKHLPESDYIKIELNGEEITGDWWQTLDTDILPSFQVKRNAAYIIQAYDHRFKGMDQLGISEIDVYIPVETA